LLPQPSIAPFVAALDERRSEKKQTQLVTSVASCGVRSISRRASSLSGKCSGDCPDADDDPSLVVQDMDLFSSLALKLSHTENPTPDGFEVRRQMPLVR
jgi:hypothetical protein